MDNFGKNAIVGIAGAIVGLLGLGYGIAMHSKLAKVSNRLDVSIDKLVDGMEINIPDELVNRAVEQVASSEAKKAVAKATSEALDTVKRDIHSNVSAAVEAEYTSIKDTVLKNVTDEASKIDVARIRKDVEKAAHATAMKKFNDNLDDILDKFNDNLNNVSKIYSSIAGTATRNSDKEVVFKLG